MLKGKARALHEASGPFAGRLAQTFSLNVGNLAIENCGVLSRLPGQLTLGRGARAMANSAALTAYSTVSISNDSV